MPKIAAISSQARPWGVRGPRVSAARRKAMAKVARMYFAVKQMLPRWLSRRKLV